MKISDYITDFLLQQNVHHVFYMIGGAITHLVDSLSKNTNMHCITMHHEQAAAFAAEAYARCNSNLGVAMATSGPGATNLITGIGSCFFDSVPCVFITGQVNTYEYKFDLPVRQIGFQETDIVSIVKPIVKGARLIDKAENVKRDLEWAVHLARSGRPGPVLLDIPMNIQRVDVDIEHLPSFIPEKNGASNISDALIQEITHCLRTATRPMILAGGGIRTAGAAEKLFELIEKTKIPVVTSLMGLDAFPHDHPSYIGMIGAYGNRSANIALANADFLLILGSRLETRQTGTRPETFARAATIVHVDIDEMELNRSVKTTKYTVKTDIKNFLNLFNKCINETNICTSNFWLDYVEKCKEKFPSFCSSSKTQEIHPNEFTAILSHEAADDAIITVDVGQHQMWVAQSFIVKRKQRVLISGGMGAMGFALPTAIGAALLGPQRQIIVIVGDGGFQINIQELQTIVRNNLKIKIVVMNNHSLGMVRQFQEIYFNSRTEGTLQGYNTPDFVKIAEAYEISGLRVSAKNELKKTLNLFLNAKTSILLEVMLPQSTVVEPKLIVNDPIEDQDPKLSQEELEEMMLIPMVSR